MSAANIYQDGDAVEIWTDAAAYADCGEILGMVQKVVVLDDINAAIAVQGDLRLLSALEVGLLGAFETFDALASGLTDLAQTLATELAGAAFLPTIFKTVGWSDERQRLEVWSAAVGKTIHHPSGPAQMLPAGAVHVSPGSPELFAKLAAAGLMESGDLHCDTQAERLAIIRAQRDCTFPYEVADGRAIKMVGGFAQRTIVRKGSVATDIVERWPADKVGPRGLAAMAA